MPIDMSHSIKIMKTIGLKLGYEVIRNRDLAWYDAHKERVQRAYGPHFDETEFMQAVLDVDHATLDGTFKKIDCFLYEMAYDKLTSLKSDVLNHFRVMVVKAIKQSLIVWMILSFMFIGVWLLTSGGLLLTMIVPLLSMFSAFLTIMISDNERLIISRYIGLKKTFRQNNVDSVIEAIDHCVTWTFADPCVVEFRHRLRFIAQYTYKRK